MSLAVDADFYRHSRSVRSAWGQQCGRSITQQWVRTKVQTPELSILPDIPIVLIRFFLKLDLIAKAADQL
ncbi:hypothetical protein [Paenibacillus sp. V4I3]|uniref:hypothetical protein n=1 Tax=Paenibacillus sp. V4I3 TaxID=3042305 RepID=UPI0027D8E49C|nr:hypothetical protein [Paenibacillus sp. V4I3]